MPRLLQQKWGAAATVAIAIQNQQQHQAPKLRQASSKKQTQIAGIRAVAMLSKQRWAVAQCHLYQANVAAQTRCFLLSTGAMDL